MMMSAPARRMAVSASIIARGSSIQPFRAAALSIAYSPLPRHAAAGIPDSAFPRPGLEHRVLAAHVVRGRRHPELGLHARDDVEVGHRRLHHDDIGAFLD